MVSACLVSNAEESKVVPANLAEWQKAADQGNARAQGYIGYCYQSGHGVPQDYKQAVVWFQKAADQGYALAQGSLGACYQNGQGVPQDYKQAVVWYRKAADQGNTFAQASLGYCYSIGQGVPKDYVAAYQWFNLAATSLFPGAAEFRDKLALEMTKEQIAEGQRRSSAFKPKAEVPVK